MNFWHMQLHPNNKEQINRDEVLKMLSEYKQIGMGASWDNDRGQPSKFYDEMKIGDVVLIRSDGPVALVRVTGDCKENDSDKLWFELVREVEIISTESVNYKKWYTDKHNSNWNDSLYLPTTIEIANNSNFIRYWYSEIQERLTMDELKNLLLTKNQIILQGPPGTGKTRLAKQLASALIQPTIIESVESVIDETINNTDLNNPELEELRKNRNQLLNKFCNQFPKEQLKNLTLENYCIGTGESNSFCWWIERGLKPLGYYSPGSARSYLIYWKKETEEYSKHGFIKEEDDDFIAMNKIAELLHEAINTKDITEASKYFGNGFLLKLLNTYYPDDYFPINSEKMIDNALKVLNIEFKNLNQFEKNKTLNDYYCKKKKEHKSQITSNEFARILFEKFNIKTGENIDYEENIVIKGEYKIVQFHPSYSYEDFVRGIVATTLDGIVSYKVEDKVLSELAQKALDNPGVNYVLIIDEINRANLPSVLGELIYALEYRNESVDGMYETENEGREIVLPSNLFLIGTMNTADRSVGHVDYAIRRRFAFVDVLPTQDPLKGFARPKFKLVAELFIKNFEEFMLDNSMELVRSDYLSTDFRPEDVWIGHSYFITDGEGDAGTNELASRMKYEVIPLLKEYVKDGILNEDSRIVISSL